MHEDHYPKYMILIVSLLFLIFKSNQKQNGMIYILQWSYRSKYVWEWYWYLETGQGAFISRNCSFQNCFFTANRSYLNSILDFDVLLFDVVHLRINKSVTVDLPLIRSERQLYVFVATEAPPLFPISDFYNDFFNITATYKLSSDIVYPFFVVKNHIGDVIGPNINVKWLNGKDLAPTNISVVEKLRNKRVAAAFVASHCGINLEREFLIGNLSIELSKYGHRIDLYGRCGPLSCPRDPSGRVHLLTSCHKIIESDYYFYLAFENSLAEDYVTEKVLHGLQHYAVPIVFGGADYTRFLPDGSYVDASKMGAIHLAKEMYAIINNSSRYYDFFRWHGYYSFQDTTDRDHRETVCALCAYLNKQKIKKSIRIYHDMFSWWNTAGQTACFDNAATSPQIESDENQNIISSFFSNVMDFSFDNE